MQLISTVTVGAGGAATISFSSIPQTYTDLLLVYSVRCNSATDQYVQLQFNGDTASNYTYRQLFGNGSGVASGTATLPGILAGRAMDSTVTANTFSSNSNYILNYTGSTTKQVSVEGVAENNATSAVTFINAGSWSGTAAITSLLIKPSDSSNFVQYSTASLYGILKGSGGATVA